MQVKKRSRTPGSLAASIDCRCCSPAAFESIALFRKVATKLRKVATEMGKLQETAGKGNRSWCKHSKCIEG